MIRHISNIFILDTRNTSYLFRVMNSGQMEHIYYGRKITIEDVAAAECLIEKHAFAPGNAHLYDSKHTTYTLEDVCLEMSALGKGDVREPFVEIRHTDGSFTCDFTYTSFEIHRGKAEFHTLPGSYDEKGEVETLEIVMTDWQYNIELRLYYYVYEHCDIITRSAKLINKSSERIYLDRLMSTQIDFDTADYVFTTFTGSWAREMMRSDIQIKTGKYVNSSVTGASSNRANPFVCLSKPRANEDFGEVYGFNLIYSGNHLEAVEVSNFRKLRFVQGIQPQVFCFVLEQGEEFEAPEAVMTYSAGGFNGMSQNMHTFVREHIVRGEWKNKPRPILLNSWEAAYYDINEKNLLELAKAGKEVGVELFVIDDGWFGERDDDSSSLGDWSANRKKLPGGVKGLCDKVNQLDLSFGIWVEPEMVNVNSRLYKEHSEWVIQIPGKPHSEGRSQRILDLTKKEVQDFVIQSMSKVFESANIEYVKWDMNRTFTDVFSESLNPDRQGEVFHRYMVGLYRCLSVLMNRFPHILFEGCASGGNRFDLGMLCFFPQIWASDNTDAICRAEIEQGYSYGYPMSVVSSHVSGVPNHQTFRITPFATRYAVASFGVLGYELNLCELGEKERKVVMEQTELYRQWRETYFFGKFYRGRSFTNPCNMGTQGSVLASFSENITEWTVVSPDRKRAVGMLLQKLAIPNVQYQYYRARGLDKNRRYHFSNLPQNSSYRKEEDYIACGDLLMNAGVKLQTGFTGTDEHEDGRFFPDFAARLYYMEEKE